MTLGGGGGARWRPRDLKERVLRELLGAEREDEKVLKRGEV